MRPERRLTGSSIRLNPIAVTPKAATAAAAVRITPTRPHERPEKIVVGAGRGLGSKVKGEVKGQGSRVKGQGSRV